MTTQIYYVFAHTDWACHIENKLKQYIYIVILVKNMEVIIW